MNHFDDVCGLHLEARTAANLETFQRFISKGDDPLCCIKEEDAKEIKNVIKGLGKLLAVANGRRTLAGNHKYVLFIKEKEGVKVYLYTVLNGLYNEMGPFKDLDTALSNADCYGLFEECKKIANTKVLEGNMNKKLFEEIIEEWDIDDIDTYEGDEMEDWSWDDYDDKYGGTDPYTDMNNHLADNFPTRNSEYQDDEGDYDPFSYVQMGDGEGGIGKRTKAAAYANRLKSGDNAPEIVDGDERTVLGGDFDGDETDVDFAMSDDADLDAWARDEDSTSKTVDDKRTVLEDDFYNDENEIDFAKEDDVVLGAWVRREGQETSGNKLKESGIKKVALKSGGLSYSEYYDMNGEHDRVVDAVANATGLSDWEIIEWTERSLALTYLGDPSDLTPEIVSIAKKVFSKAW